MPQKQSKIFGILNITHNSFSDGGKYLNADKALSQAKLMIDSGVDVLDVGAESTRPGGLNGDVKEEMTRLEILPNIKEIADKAGVQISLDSRNAEVIEKYVGYSDIVNDVTGFQDEKIQKIALENKKKIVLMHSKSVPVVKGEHVECEDFIKYLHDWTESKLRILYSRGFRKDQIIFDPGIGFGNSPSQAIEILKGIEDLKKLGMEILVGHARKSFMAQFGEIEGSKRDPETHAITFYLAKRRIDYIRVYDVWASKRVIRMAQEFV